jgi:Tfp pilus assembly protein PilX
MISRTTSGHRALRLRRRAGAIYLIVLATSMLVALLGLSALMAARLRLRNAGPTGDMLEAQLYAQSAIELGRYWINQDPNWRTSRTKGYWAQNVALGKGKYSLYVVDPNGTGALNQNTTDPVTLTGTGMRGTATQQVQVTLNRYDPPLTCLNTAATCNGAITFGLAGLLVTVTSSGTVACNTSIATLLSTINAPCEAVVSATGLTYTPAPVTGVSARTVPDTTSVFSYYTTNGTQIGNGGGTLGGFVATSSVNTGSGGTNANGIYVYDCRGANVTVQNCRIVGTLVLLNAGSGSTIQQNCLFQQGSTKLPVLMVQGSITINLSNSTFTEATAGTNLNPSGAPYNGVTNSTTTDTYPCEIDGLVYISGNLTTQNHPVFKGPLIINGTWTATGAVDLAPDTSYYTNPPQGFTATPQMVVAPASWQ